MVKRKQLDFRLQVKKLAYVDTISPGPGKYRDINSMPKTGNYVLSQSRGGTRAKFDKTQRESMFDQVFRKELENPGPGYYQMPS